MHFRRIPLSLPFDLFSILSEAPYTTWKPFNEQPPYIKDCRFPQLSSSSALSSNKPSIYRWRPWEGEPPWAFGAHETNSMGSHVEVEVLWDTIVNLYPQLQQLSQKIWRWKPQHQNHVQILQRPRMTGVPPLWSKRYDQQCLFHMHYQSSDIIKSIYYRFYVSKVTDATIHTH